MSVEPLTLTPVKAEPKPPRPFRERLSSILPQLVLTPSLIATLVYVFLFCGWTIWISLSNSSLLPDYSFSGFHHYAELWVNRRWNVAYTNLFLFSVLYVIGTMAIGLTLAILIDQRIRAEALWRTIYLYPLAVSFVVTGTVWRWLMSPATGIEPLMHQLGWTWFKFDWLVQREMAIYCVVITGIWQASGFVMALFLAGLRSIDPDLIKAAQIDGATMPRIYRRIIHCRDRCAPAIRDQDLRTRYCINRRRTRHRYHGSCHLCLRSYVPARPNGGRCGRGDHDSDRALAGACPLRHLDKFAPTQGGPPWLKQPLMIRLVP